MSVYMECVVLLGGKGACRGSFVSVRQSVCVSLRESRFRYIGGVFFSSSFDRCERRLYTRYKE